MRPRRASVAKDSRNPTRPWVVRWSESTEDGHRKRKSKANPKQRAADRFASRKTRELRGEVAPIDEPTVEPVGGLGDTPLGVFVDEYLSRRRGELRAATYSMYVDNLSRLRNHFGDGRAIGSVTRDDAAKFIADQRMITKGREGQPLSRSSVNGIICGVKTMFATAKAWGYIVASPMDAVKKLKVHQDDKRGWHYLTPAQFLRLLDATPCARRKAVYGILYGTGLRYGEAYSLRPADIDLVGATVHIRTRAGTDAMPSFRVKDHERRSIPIPAYAVRLVQAWMDNRPKGSPYVFVTPERYTSIRTRWHRVRASGEQWRNRWMVNNALHRLHTDIARAEITLDAPITLHSLRKSYGKNGSIHLKAEVLKDYMGHSDIATTLTYYSKRVDDDDVKARWVLYAIVDTAGDAGKILSDVQSDVSNQRNHDRKVG